jgi:hypothetical protein
MHPSYGAGHATVAGACVTILKAFFDEDACIARITNAQHDNVGDVVAVSPDEISNDRTRPAGPNRKDYIEVAFVPDKDGKLLDDKVGAFGDFLRVGDELNKLAANISIARNMAGVHYYSDYIDSLRMGEQIALGVLQEQSIMYPKDPFQVSLTSFDGKRVIIGDGEIQCLGAETEHHTPKHYPQSEALEDLIAALEKSPDLGKKLLASFSEKMPANEEKPGTKVA